MRYLFVGLFLLLGSTGADLSPNFEERSLSEHEMRMVEQAGFSYLDRLAQLEEELYSQGHYVKETSSLYRMAKFKQPSSKAIELGQKAMVQLEATRFLKSELGLTGSNGGDGLVRAAFSVINNTCLVAPTCTASKYRTIDGSCNSLTLTNLGQSNTDYRRMTSPNYADGIQIPRLATNGSDLPSARLVSTVVFGNTNSNLNMTTLALMQFGQLINHDYENTVQFTYANGSAITCCSSSNSPLPASQQNPACLAIPVPVDDRFFNKATLVSTCMNFVRSIAGPRLDCSLGYADQLNQNTHWLDASTVYGSTSSTTATLRQFSKGLLLMTNDAVNNRTLLPQSTPCPAGPCFFAGDPRATEHPQLTVMHTIWAREHNRVAKALSAMNPTWSDESIFQEARRIVIAEMQHITYNEFLPSLLSPATIANYSLAPLTSGYFTGYVANVASGPVSNEFATAAFRMGHSLVQGLISLYDESGNLLPSSYQLSNTFNNASMIVNDPTFFDAAIRGLLTQPSQTVDKQVVDELWNFLFRNATIKWGFDVVALNIQRGRDHGLPSYNTYRQLCGFPKLTSFSDLNLNLGFDMPRMGKGIQALFQSIYASVDDIDLYVGGLSENSLSSGGLVGPTFACIIGEHFKTLKTTDRYYYEIGNQQHSFSDVQLAEIRKASMARIFCDNNDGSVLSVQPKAFAPFLGTNAKTLCTNTATIPTVNLKLWKDEPLP